MTTEQFRKLRLINGLKNALKLGFEPNYNEAAETITAELGEVENFLFNNASIKNEAGEISYNRNGQTLSYTDTNGYDYESYGEILDNSHIEIGSYSELFLDSNGEVIRIIVKL